ncbi:DUF3572 family protein [Antarcticirhabdus aurantiaca]|uniref:DUF3572 family protein n=1 Tax=Antarcticirhabdus aurantiaca TaxID=2606717 RepID=UPI0034E2BB66
MAEDPKLFKRFLDLSGLEVGQLRAEATKRAFFAGLLDFILSYEPTTMELRQPRRARPRFRADRAR